MLHTWIARLCGWACRVLQMCFPPNVTFWQWVLFGRSSPLVFQSAGARATSNIVQTVPRRRGCRQCQCCGTGKGKEGWLRISWQFFLTSRAKMHACLSQRRGAGFSVCQSMCGVITQTHVNLSVQRKWYWAVQELVKTSHYSVYTVGTVAEINPPASGVQCMRVGFPLTKYTGNPSNQLHR